MTNQTVVQVVDALEPKFPNMPVVGVVTVCNILDRSRTNSVESVVEEIKRLITLAGLECKASPCDIVAELMCETLLSDGSDPLHIYMFDIIPICNKAMMQCSERNDHE